MALSDLEIGGIRPFDVNSDPSSVAVKWKRWLRSFQLYADGKGLIIIADKDDNKIQRRALLLHCAGPDVQDIFDVLPDTGGAKDYENAVRALNDHFVTQVNIPYERHQLREMSQKEDETIDQFSVRLRRKAETCDYGDHMEDEIRDQIISKCRSTNLRRKFLEKGQGLKLKQLQDIARTFEAVRRQSNSMSVASEEAQVNKVEMFNEKKYGNEYNRSGQSGHYAKDKNSLTMLNQKGHGNECYRCGQVGHFARNWSCPARNKTCAKCNIMGHFAVMCKSQKPQRKDFSQKVKYMQDQDDEDDSDEYSFTISDKFEDAQVEVKMGGVPVNMIVDSGSSVNVIDKALWERLKKQKIKCISKRNTRKLYAYGATEPLEVVGTFTAELKVGNSSVSAEVIVIQGKGEPLLGKKSALELGVLKLQVPGVSVRNVVGKSELLAKYSDVFKGVGKLENYQLTLHIDPSVKPVAQPLRRPAFSLRDKIEKKLKELLHEDIIEEVNGPTPWVNPVVVVPKPNGEIRLCVDMRCANAAIIRERHPIPTVDEVLQEMEGGSVFSKLDLKWGYHQIELSEESRGITTFVTHKGLYRYKRLMFGITSAPEKYQQVMQQVLSGCEGAQNISDDIIVYGTSREEHDHRLEKVLMCIKNKGLTLNREKSKFYMSQLTFMGLVLTPKGIGPTEERVKAVLEAREPENASEVKSFLGMVNFSAKFIPDLATVSEPLRRLTKKGVQFVFGPEQKSAFQELQQRLAKAETLAYFKKDAKTKIVTDASPVGLGAVLIQEQDGINRVIYYASRGLTDVERRYSQTEKEALGIVWACERFHVYLYGIDFELWTDHQPLTFIYAKRSRPSARIERWVLRLQPYSFVVNYVPGHQNVADALSRLTRVTESTSRNVAEEQVCFVAKTAIPRAMTAEEIDAESAVDEELQEIRNCINTENWDNPNCVRFKPVRHELCILGNMVLRGNRIVIPQKLRNRVIELGHEGHPGIVQTKQRLRTKVWWPSIDKESEKYCKTCHGCQVVSSPTNPEPIQVTELPQGPWQDIAIDYMGPLPSGHYVFAVVDYYSRYVEIRVNKRNTAEVTVECLEQIFATHGLPNTVATDNGPHFIASVFKEFLHANGIKQRRKTPLWPQANGEIERQNRSILKRLKIAQVEGQDWKQALRTYLVAYRNTPHCTTGISPAELLFGRTLRTKLPDVCGAANLDEEMRDTDRERKEKGKQYADNRRNAKESNLAAGDQVLLKQPKGNKLTATFESEPYEVINKKGNSVLIESPEGVQYKRNTTHVKQYLTRESEEAVGERETDVEQLEYDQGSVQAEEKQVEQPKSPRPVRLKSTPKKFDDFVMG